LQFSPRDEPCPALTLEAGGVENLTSILGVVEKGPEAALLVEKAVRLARPNHASIRLFSCDLQSAQQLQRSYDERDLQPARAASIAEQTRHHARLLGELSASGLRASAEAAWESSFY
jgi:hypothetical protein